VQALRDDAVPLDDQLRRLCAQQQAEFTASGSAQPLSPRMVVSLYRVAQEALTNVVKARQRSVDFGEPVLPA
jgi:signal transduction histidine kinase